MMHDEYRRKREFLLAALWDAEERGDYHLEMDVKEKLAELQDSYYHEDEE
jgi:hypothetical protein